MDMVGYIDLADDDVLIFVPCATSSSVRANQKLSGDKPFGGGDTAQCALSDTITVYDFYAMTASFKS